MDLKTITVIKLECVSSVKAYTISLSLISFNLSLFHECCSYLIMLILPNSSLRSRSSPPLLISDWSLGRSGKKTIAGGLRGVGVSWNSSHHGLVKSNGESKLLESNDRL